MASAKITINGDEMTIKADYDRSGHMGRYYRMIRARWNPTEKVWTASASADIFDASRVYRGHALDVIKKALEQWMGDVEVVIIEPEPPTPTEASEAEQSAEQTPEEELDSGEYGMICIKCLEPATENAHGDWYCKKHVPAYRLVSTNLGGARPGSGRPKLGETYEQGYQAGYKAGLRAAKNELLASYESQQALLEKFD